MESNKNQIKNRILSLQDLSILDLLKTNSDIVNIKNLKHLKSKIIEIQKLKTFLERYFGNKAYLYLNDLNFQVIRIGYSTDQMNESIEKYVDKNSLFFKELQKNQHDHFFCHSVDFISQTALHIACDNGNLEIINILLEKGASLNIGTYLHDICPIYIIFHKNVDLFKKIGISKFDIQIRNKNGFSLLDIEISRKNVEGVKLLVENGFDINATGYEGLTPIESIELLIEEEPNCEIYQEILKILKSSPKKELSNHEVKQLGCSVSK